MAMKMEEVPCSRPELAGKEIYLVRHAQGQHNVATRFEYDPILTSQGLNQVRQQKALAQSLGVDLVLVSPLRRTLQTATGLFPQHGNMVSFEALREGVSESCNLRLPIEAFAGKFPEVDFSLVEPGPDKHLYRFLPRGESTVSPDKYQELTDVDCRIEETDKEMDDRAEQVISFVASRPEKKIALVSHCVFLRALVLACRKGMPARTLKGLTKGMGAYAEWFENCEIRSLKHVSPETN